MNTDNFGDIGHPETLDADAVCAKCNTVNSEGTLLCKTCGNNLRDQRAIRLAADQAMDLDHPGLKRRTWVSGILFVLAFALIVSTLLNQELIVDWLVNPGSSATTDVMQLWNAPYSDTFTPLLDILEARDVTEEYALASLQSPIDATTLDGTYALFMGETYIGSAQALADGDAVYVVALLDNGSEVRGIAIAQGNHYAATPDFLAMERRGRMIAARGVAMPQGGGVFDCIGDDDYGRQIKLSAYQLPAAE